jgi:uncharacterized repeat protein (TIGR03847 family)
MSGTEMQPEIFTADYVGEPGRRAFFLQARRGSEILSYPIEKQQVAVLGEKLRELLLMIDQKDTVTATPAGRDPALALTEPVTPEPRVGAIGLAYEDDADQVVVFLQPAEEAEEESDLEQALSPESFAAKFNLRRDQVRAFVVHAAAVVEEGRPTCQLCGLPMDPEGHNCPASNGHRSSA